MLSLRIRHVYELFLVRQLWSCIFLSCILSVCTETVVVGFVAVLRPIRGLIHFCQQRPRRHLAYLAYGPTCLVHGVECGVRLSRLITSPLVGAQSIAISRYVCLSVCPIAHLNKKLSYRRRTGATLFIS